MKCLNETVKQLIDSVQNVQDDQFRMSQIIENLATKVKYTIFFLNILNFPSLYFFQLLN